MGSSRSPPTRGVGQSGHRPTKKRRPSARTRRPQPPALAIVVGGGLIAEHDRHEGQLLKLFEIHIHRHTCRTRGRQYKNATRRPHQHARERQIAYFPRIGSRRRPTLSVVNDMPRKSPVIMMITISIGVRIACPVMISAAARNKHLHDLLGNGIQRVGEDALEGQTSLVDRGDDARQAPAWSAPCRPRIWPHPSRSRRRCRSAPDAARAHRWRRRRTCRRCDCPAVTP